MDQEDFDRYLHDRYEDQCNWYSRKARRNKKLYLWFQVLILGFSATTTLAIALGIYFPEWPWMRLVALAVTSVVTVLASLEKVFRFQELWVEYRDTSETLKKEKYLFAAKLGEYATAESAEKVFVGRVENLISRQNTLWVRQTSKADANGKSRHTGS